MREIEQAKQCQCTSDPRNEWFCQRNFLQQLRHAIGMLSRRFCNNNKPFCNNDKQFCNNDQQFCNNDQQWPVSCERWISAAVKRLAQRPRRRLSDKNKRSETCMPSLWTNFACLLILTSLIFRNFSSLLIRRREGGKRKIYVENRRKVRRWDILDILVRKREVFIVGWIDH